jgi:hypothetical protein
VKIVDVLLGRTKPIEANLDNLFGLPSAFITLEASEGLVPSGEAGVCYKPMAGQPFVKTTEEIEGLLSVGGDPATVRQESDSFGYHWIVLSGNDPQALVTQAHMVNTTLQEDGYGPQLLCSVFGFRPKSTAGSASVYLVYLYKRGSFYPFVPLAGHERRDLETELRLEVVLTNELKVEKEKERWMALWGLPVH